MTLIKYSVGFPAPAPPETAAETDVGFEIACAFSVDHSIAQSVHEASQVRSHGDISTPAGAAFFLPVR